MDDQSKLIFLKLIFLFVHVVDSSVCKCAVQDAAQDNGLRNPQHNRSRINTSRFTFTQFNGASLYTALPCYDKIFTVLCFQSA